MRGMNRIVLVGRLGREPELRASKGGGSWCTFSLATNRSRREGDGWVEEADWHEVRVFGEDADRCQRRLRKGSVVAVDGSLVYDTWTDDAGQKRRKARIVASRIQFVTDLRVPVTGSADEDGAEDAEASDPGAEPTELTAF